MPQSPTSFLPPFLAIAREMSPRSIAQHTYGPDADDGYLDEKTAHIQRNFLGWLCTLDSTRLRRLEDVLARLAAGTCYLSGDVWEFAVFDPDGEQIDACSGFYGEDAALESGEESRVMHDADYVDDPEVLGPTYVVVRALHGVVDTPEFFRTHELAQARADALAAEEDEEDQSVGVFATSSCLGWEVSDG